MLCCELDAGFTRGGFDFPSVPMRWRASRTRICREPARIIGACARNGVIKIAYPRSAPLLTEQDTMKLVAEIVDKFSPQMRAMQKETRALADLIRSAGEGRRWWCWQRISRAPRAMA